MPKLKSRINLTQNLSMMRISSLIFLLCLSTGDASAFVSDSLDLAIVFPANNDTLHFERIRYAGSVNPAARVSVQGEDTKVYASGAFAGTVELEDGWNAIAFAARIADRVAHDTVWIFREKGAAYEETPTAVDRSRIKPGGNVYLFPGDQLEVEFRGSPGGVASFSIEDIADNVGMRAEYEEGQGVYRGSVTLPAIEEHRPVPVRFRLKGMDGRSVKFESPGRVRVLPAELELFGITSDSVNIVRREIEGRIWLELPARVKMKIVGVLNGHKKVELAPNVTGYIDAGSLKTLPVGRPVPKAEIGEIAVVEFGEWVQIQFPLTERVPFVIRQFPDPQKLEVVFYHTAQAPARIQNQRLAAGIQSLDWQQEEDDVVRVQIYLNQSQQWGFWGSYLGDQLWLNIRKTPSLSDSTLEGLRITLDPGHGGEHEGALGPTGLTEKAVNLRLAKKAAQYLELFGASVSMTRSQDSTVTLASRVAFARKNHAHILVSLHHNSIAGDKDPLRPKGTTVYYHTPQSQEIAGFVYRKLVDLNLAPFGLRRSDYFVARQTDMLAFLIEGAFLTHPEDELLLLDEVFLDKMARAIADGIREFIMSWKARAARVAPHTFDGNQSDVPRR